MKLTMEKFYAGLCFGFAFGWELSNQLFHHDTLLWHLPTAVALGLMILHIAADGIIENRKVKKK